MNGYKFYGKRESNVLRNKFLLKQLADQKNSFTFADQTVGL